MVNLSILEEVMYKVMKAIYESGIPIDFKGSMVLKAYLAEAGYDEDTRHTVDIDANWQSDAPPTAEQMVSSLQSAIDSTDLNLDVSIYRMFDDVRSAGFEISDHATEEIIFTMDIDVNRPAASTKLYEVNGLRFRGTTPSQMIADKISAISSDKIFRRVKDLVDLYYLSNVTRFDRIEFNKIINDSSRTLGDFDGFMHRKDELRHAYDKFRFAGDVRKVPFEEVYAAVKNFIHDVLPCE